MNFHKKPFLQFINLCVTRGSGGSCRPLLLHLGGNWMRTWQKEIRILGEDFLIKKEIVEAIIKEVEKSKYFDSRSFYSMAQKKLFKYM